MGVEIFAGNSAVQHTFPVGRAVSKAGGVPLDIFKKIGDICLYSGTLGDIQNPGELADIS